MFKQRDFSDSLYEKYIHRIQTWKNLRFKKSFK